MMRSGTTTAEVMAAELGVSERTVYRYIKLMRSAGAKIKSGAGCGYRIFEKDQG